MKCVVCGKEIDSGYICGKCAVERLEVVDIRPFEILQCSRCEAVKIGRKWLHVGIEKAIEDNIFKNSRIIEDFDVKNVRIDLSSNTVEFEGTLYGDEVRVTTQLRYKIKKISCPKCSRESGGYYESIVQLRADNRDLRDYEIETTKRIIEEVLTVEVDNEMAFLSKVEERKEGVDFYFGSRDIGRKISRKIARELGGKISESKKLHTRIDGRDVYRFTYLVRLPSYEEGDIVEKDGILFVVKNRVTLKGVSIIDGRSKSIEGARIVARKNDLLNGVVVNVDESVAEIVCENGSVVITEKPFGCEIGSEVYVFEFDGKPYSVLKDL